MQNFNQISSRLSKGFFDAYFDVTSFFFFFYFSTFFSAFFCSFYETDFSSFVEGASLYEIFFDFSIFVSVFSFLSDFSSSSESKLLQIYFIFWVEVWLLEILRLFQYEICWHTSCFFLPFLLPYLFYSSKNSYLRPWFPDSHQDHSLSWHNHRQGRYRSRGDISWDLLWRWPWQCCLLSWPSRSNIWSLFRDNRDFSWRCPARLIRFCGHQGHQGGLTVG